MKKWSWAWVQENYRDVLFTEKSPSFVKAQKRRGWKWVGPKSQNKKVRVTRKVEE